MKQLEELVASIEDLSREDLEAWMRDAMVKGQTADQGVVFSDAECARVRLISTLRYDLDIEAGTLPLVLDLIDELHEARRRLRLLGEAVLAEGNETRTTILDRLERGRHRS